MAEIYDKAVEFRDALLKRERQAASILVRSYGQSWNKIQKLLARLTAQIDDAQRRGLPISPAWLFQQERYQQLILQIEREITKFAHVLDAQVKKEQSAAIRAAARNTAELAEAAQTPGVTAGFTKLSPAAIESITAFVQEGTPLGRLLAELPRGAGKAVADALVEAVSLGYNPVKTARIIRREMGMTLTRALTIARTETLRAYREATHRSYQANDDIVQGWIWVASFSRRTCVSCLALHGQWFPMTERQSSHPRCRCTSIPALKGDANPITESGEAWLKKQPEDIQRTVLGTKAGFERFKNGELTLKDFVGLQRSPQWGDSYVQLSVKRALNGEARFPKFAAPTMPVSPMPAPFSPPVVRNYREFEPAPWASSSSPQSAKEMIIRRYADQTYPLTAYRAQWTPPELRSVQDYVGNWYQPINDYLRGKKSRIKDWNVEDLKFRVKAIDAALAKNELAEDTVLFRGANLPELRRLFDSGEDVIGSVWPEKAYVSTSFNAEISRVFAQSRGMRPVVFRIKANKGTKGAYVSHINREFHPTKPDYHNGESEFLLSRNTELYITGAKYVKLKGRKVLQLEAEIWTEELAATRKAKILTTKRQKTTR